ncbi:DUF3710 domain-containing protein [Nocardioides sp. 503]|uniref:DUF3710 domain-containing protein n=1 Tax=Nocardioides sp. 503 TaxID=2508326 RepID=UPI00107004C6|nr:DUF3710 domain-containing protein [Nocardioides sp. 503]
MKFRRKSDADAVPETVGESDSPDADSGPVGPHDVDDLPEGVDRVDLGSLVIEPEAGRELRLQVDEQSGNVQAVVLAGADGALELRAFAAPRNGDLWSDVRPQIAADMARRGGTATEREGRFGPELLCELTVTRADGSTGSQPSRIIGVNGPRWLLRATFLGRPAVEPEAAEAWEDTLRKVAVRRGAHALPVGEPLPLILPENARRTDAPSE